ncbi:MAG: PAS domain S-box protein, partial [Desulfatitalea sp.]|nr:PAS domain S-box protein [Desulfatitalea sp.]
MKTTENNAALYRTVFETTGAGTIIIEADTTIAMANSAFAALVGMAKEEIEGKLPWPQVIADPRDREKMLCYHQARRNTPDAVPQAYEFKLVDKQGHKRDVWLRVNMIAGTELSVASLFDITPLKKIERDLRASETKLSGILEAFGGFTYTCDGDWRIAYMNKTLQTLIGRECIGERCHRAIYRRETPCPWCDRERVFQGATVRKEFQSPLDQRWYIALSSPL